MYKLLLKYLRYKMVDMIKYYTVYRRNNELYICGSEYNYLLKEKEIIKTHIKSYSEASRFVSELFYKEHKI